MSLAPYRHNYGQIITTDVPDFNVDRGFIANLTWTAAQTVAADAEGIFKDVSAPDGTAVPAEVAITLTPASAEFVAQPPCARNVVVTFAATTPGDIKAAAVVVTGKKPCRADNYRELYPNSGYCWRKDRGVCINYLLLCRRMTAQA